VLQRILVPLDGSRFAEIALPVAARLASRANASLRLVRIHEPALPVVPPLEGGPISVAEATEQRAASAAYLAEVAARVEPVGSPGIVTELIDGMAGPALAEQIAWWCPDLVVMATHGRGPFSRAWIGSVADYLVRHVSAPLLLLRPKDDADWPPPDLHLRHILVPTDLSLQSEAIFAPVSALAVLTGAAVELVHVLGPLKDAAARGRAEKQVTGMADRMRRPGLSVTSSIVGGPGTVASLLDLIETGPCDLVALTTHGRGGPKRALLGSIADKLIRAAVKPVLVTRAPHPPPM
jgi:nucleotide-binding universal stress UspA family protein